MFQYLLFSIFRYSTRQGPTSSIHT